MPLFSSMNAERVCFVGSNNERTNTLSAALIDLVGNPYGVRPGGTVCSLWSNPETCGCYPGLGSKTGVSLAVGLNHIQATFAKPQPDWIHLLFLKQAPCSKFGRQPSVDRSNASLLSGDVAACVCDCSDSGSTAG